LKKTLAENSEILSMLRRIESRLSAIEAVLQPRRCSPADLEVLGRLVPALGRKFGSEVITTRQILQDPGLAALNSGSVRTTGALLSRAVGDQVVIGGLQVLRVGREHNKTLWQVVRTLPDSVATRGSP
jgi:hypothetical protein